MKLPVTIVIALLAGAANAAMPTMPHSGACATDAAKLCPTEVASKDKTAVAACLKTNIAKVSPDCRENLIAVAKAKAAESATPK